MKTKIKKVPVETMKIIYDEFKELIEKYADDKKAKSMALKDFQAIETVLCILGSRGLLKK